MPDESRPNVLWLVLEDVSPRLGCYGDDLAETPRIDDLAADGRRYDRAFSTAPVCAPSRASLTTGVCPQRLGAHHMRTDTHDVPELPDSYEAVPPHYVTAATEYLRQAGYYCTLDVKTDYQFGEPATMWDNHARGADWRDDARDPDQPFFAMLTNKVTHESGMWEPGPEIQEGGAVEHPAGTVDPAEVEPPPYLPDTEPTRRAIARHYENLLRADEWVGEVLDRLAADGHAEDTVVVLTSDHGEGLPRAKRWPYDSGTNVPLIVRWPGRVDGGEAAERVVSLVDLPATTLSLAGVDVPQWMDGRPFLGSDTEDRQYAVSTRDRYDESYDLVRSITDGRYRYVRHYYADRPYVLHVPYRNRHPAMEELLRLDAEGGLDPVQRQWLADSRPAEELYDTEADPHEVENLADDPEYEDVLDRLRSALDDWQERVDDHRHAEEPETQMRDRIWPDGDQPETSTPRIVPNAPGNRGREPVEGDVTVEGPATVSLYCPTQGASMEYAIGEDGRWEIYHGPIRLEPGDEVRFRARAVRYGYAESGVRETTIRVE